ncbi:hypothetical protein SLEP1_g56314 [Rubroshorea leprosula]|uniref:Uncharacterized protein n=1 Tax=Rubroshorea leprosula TaxID=152421 RepID=A0AAV5MKB0_9ROSI|nr:hypothetical protein SLEP1_g56314 [Rubroshorea leprosula]
MRGDLENFAAAVKLEEMKKCLFNACICGSNQKGRITKGAAAHQWENLKKSKGFYQEWYWGL